MHLRWQPSSALWPMAFLTHPCSHWGTAVILLSDTLAPIINSHVPSVVLRAAYWLDLGLGGQH